MAGQSIYELKNENKKLRFSLALAQGRLKTKYELIKTLEKRLERMAERLTGLAAERNEIYAEVKKTTRLVRCLQDELDNAHTIKGSRP